MLWGLDGVGALWVLAAFEGSGGLYAVGTFGALVA